MSTTTTNTTQSHDDDITKSVNDLFDFMINKALILCFTILCICVLVLIICVVIYKIIRTRKQKFVAVNASSTHLEGNNTNDVQDNSLREVSHSNAGKLGFDAIHNTSQSQHDNISIGNKDNMSLSELRVQNEKFAVNSNSVINSSGSKNSNSTQSSNDSNDIEVKVKKTKGKKKRKTNNANSNRSNTESSKGDDVVTPKDDVDIENELQKQMEMYKGD